MDEKGKWICHGCHGAYERRVETGYCQICEDHLNAEFDELEQEKYKQEPYWEY